MNAPCTYLVALSTIEVTLLMSVKRDETCEMVLHAYTSNAYIYQPLD